MIKKNKNLLTFITLVCLFTLLFLNIKLKKEKDILNLINATPTADNIIKLLKLKNPNNLHPRLMATKEDFSRIKEQIRTEKSISDKYESIKAKADSILEEDPVKYELPDGIRLLSISRKALDRIQTLAFVYNISNEKKYADRTVLELMTISNDNLFPDWNPTHFLDTAEMTNAAAIGYDWLYNYLTDSQKSTLRNAIVDKGLNEAMNLYSNKKGWVDNSDNWNAVCNGGIGIGAIAIADEGDEFELVSGKILEYAINSIPLSLSKFDPDGGWYEGLSYWDYAITYTTYFLSSLDSSLGTNYELDKIPGLSFAGDFPIYITGPIGSFNFADSPVQKLKSPTILWLANKFNKGEYVWYYNKVTSPTDTNIMSLLWYKNSLKATHPKEEDKLFNNIQLATMHTSLLNPDDTFVGFKAGTNNLTHSDLDIGTFVYDTLGERWFCDLGSENYNLPGYWERGIDGQRWNYYKKSTEGHNTLLINPKTNLNQSVNAETKISTFTSNDKKSFLISDITDAYKEDALSVKRGIALYKDSGSILIQDEINLKKPSDIWWLAHTEATIKISKDKKSAILYKNKKSINVTILAPSNASFTVLNTESLNNSKKTSTEISNDIKRLAIHLTNTDASTISVYISPSNYKYLNIPKTTRLDYWE